MSALEVIGFTKEEVDSIYQILASILLLVRLSLVSFTEDFYFVEEIL